MRLQRWFCYNCGDEPTESTAWLQYCLLHAIILLSFIVDTIAALDLGHHTWPLCNPPDPNTFSVYETATSTILYFTASTIIHHANSHYQWRDRFLFVGITSGVASGLLFREGLQEAILEFMPWTVLLSLLFSTIHHRTNQFARSRTPVLEEKTPLLP